MRILGKYFTCSISACIASIFFACVAWSCVKEEPNFWTYQSKGRAVLLRIPNSWVFTGNSKVLNKFDENLSYIGLNINNGCFVGEKKEPIVLSLGMRYYLAAELSSVKSKNPYCKIVSINVDSLNNSIVINYKNENYEKNYYFSHAVFMRPTHYVTLNFKGIDNEYFRILVAKIIKSAVVKDN